MSQFVINPNWRDPNDYPTPGEVSKERWASEFLFRNAEFLNELRVSLMNISKPPSKYERPLGEEKSSWAIAQICFPEELIGEVDSFEESPYLDDEGVFAASGDLWNENPILAMCRRWGIERIGYPEEFMDSLVTFSTRYPHLPDLLFEVNGGLFEGVIEREQKDCALLFDVSKPIDPQLARAKKLLKRFQKYYRGDKREKGRDTTAMYPFYLRVLDALAERVSRNEIKDVLSLDYHKTAMDDSAFYNWERAAMELRDGGYRNIPI